MTAARSITKVLTSPSKVAHALDWKKLSGSILSLSIVRDRIDLAIASHPSSSDPIQPLPSIPLKTTTVKNQKILDHAVVEELADVVRGWQVCGIVVSWPVQKEGWCGAPCGRVLRTLDQITAQSNNILTPNRPVCLWDYEHHEPAEDEWGRAAVYAEATNKKIHKASEEQYQDHGALAADIWNDFCRAHWPELYKFQSNAASKKEANHATSKQNAPDLSWLDTYEDTAAYARH